MANDPLRIGVASCFFHADPTRPIFKGKTLLYLEESLAHWLMAGGAVPLLLPTPAAGIRVDAASERTQQPCNRERRVRFECVMNRMRIAGERPVDGAVGVADGARAVDIGWSADALDDGLHADAVADETAFAGLKR